MSTANVPAQEKTQDKPEAWMLEKTQDKPDVSTQEKTQDNPNEPTQDKTQDDLALQCNICSASTKLFCSRCKTVRYCSKEHQVQDWPSHKAICRRVVEARNSSPSSLQTVLTFRLPKRLSLPTTIGARFTVDAMLFPCDEPKPRMVKAEFQVERDDEFEQFNWIWYNHINKEKYLGLGPTDSRIAQKQCWDGPPLSKDGKATVKIIFRDNYLGDGSRPSQSILAVCGGHTYHPWAGNMLALFSHDHYGQPEPVANLTPNLLSVLVEFFKHYGRE